MTSWTVSLNLPTEKLDPSRLSRAEAKKHEKLLTRKQRLIEKITYIQAVWKGNLDRKYVRQLKAHNPQALSNYFC